MDDDALTAAVAEALAAHQYVPSGLRGVSRCACGAPFHGMPHYHRAHAAEQVARVVREHTAAKQAEALREAARALPGCDGIRTHGDAARWLRDRAERLHPKPTPKES